MKKADPLRPLAAELMEVNYQNPDSLKEGVEEADAVVHLVGALKPRRGENLQEANVSPTKAMVEAAVAAKIKCFIFLSHPGADPDSKNPYLQTKGIAEQIIRDAGFAGAIFRIPMILGTGNPSLETILRLARAPLTPLIGGGTVRIQPVSQSDVVAAIDWALSANPRPMRTITLAGPETLTYANLVHRVAARIGKRPKNLPIPKAAAKLAIWIASGFSPHTGANQVVIETLFNEFLEDSGEARNNLPFTLAPVNEILDQIFPKVDTP